MSKPSDILKSPFHRIGVAGCTRSRAFGGIGVSLRFPPRACVFLVAIAGAMACSSVPASAFKAYIPSTSFGEPGSGPGQFSEPVGVAVNDSTELGDEQAGDVYVVDKGNDRVERFSAAGKFEGEFNGSGTLPGEGIAAGSGGKPGEISTGRFSSPEQIAVDNSTEVGDPSKGDVYVVDTGHEVIDKFSATGAYLGQFTEGCTPKPGCSVGALNRFGDVHAVAVDLSGNLWLYGGPDGVEFGGPEGEEINEFSNTGSFVQVFGIHSSPDNNNAFAIDSQDSTYVGNSPNASVIKLTATGQVAREYSQFNGVKAVAIDPSTNGLFVDKGAGIERYGPFGEPEPGKEVMPLETFPSEGLSESSGFAVNATGTVYASQRSAGNVESFIYVAVPETSTQAPTGVSETGLTLHGSVNPEGEAITECYFEYGTEVGKYTNRVECEPPAGEGAGQIGKGTAPVPVSAQLSGFAPANARSFRLVAVNPAGSIGRGHDVTVSRPTIAAESSSEVGPSNATVGGQIDPGGLPTEYHVEYGITEEYGAQTPQVSLSGGYEGNEARSAAEKLTGLLPGTVYHARIVASNSLGTTAGGDLTLRTFPLAPKTLPDGRVYELASTPPYGRDGEVYIQEPMQDLSNNEEHGIWTTHPFEASSDGNAVVYAGDPLATGGTGKIGGSNGDEFIARRSPDGEWTQAELESENEEHGQFVAFTPALSTGVTLGGAVPGTGAPTGYHNVYVHPTGAGAGGEYQPSFTTTTPDAPFFESSPYADQLVYAGANRGTATVPPFSRVLFEDNAGLIEGEGELEKELREDVKKEVDEHVSNEFVHYLYESVAGRSYLIDVLPNGKVAPGATFGSLEENDSNGYTHPGFSHVISADGSRVFWTYAPKAGLNSKNELVNRSQGLYVRENPTQPQSPLEGEECTVPTDACTVEIAGEGSTYQTASADGSKVFLTVADGELYEYDLETNETTDITPGTKVLGVAGASEDGEYLYYADSHRNLMLWHEGKLTLVAAAAAQGSAAPFATGEGGGGFHNDYITEIGSRTAETTSDGHNLVFMSAASLTGYKNEGLEEVNLYNAPTGTLTCVSCNPSGEPPVPTRAHPSSATGTIGAFIPLTGEATNQARSVSDDGSRVFFDTGEPLVPQDTNGFIDVYEWERDGTGSCQSSRGCVYLLSGGTDPENSYLIGTSASGDDVFFISRAELTPADRGGGNFVVYDARIGGVQPPSPASCSGTGCQGVPPAPPIFATPASVTFNGIGNFPPLSPLTSKPVVKKLVKCKKPRKLRHGRCVKAKVKVKGKKAGRGAKTNGGASGKGAR